MGLFKLNDNTECYDYDEETSLISSLSESAFNILLEDTFLDLISCLSEETIDILSDPAQCDNYLDHIASLSESTVALLGNDDIQLLYEAIGAKTFHRIGNMIMNHRSRDAETFNRGKAKNFSKENNVHHTFMRGAGKLDNTEEKNLGKLRSHVEQIKRKHNLSNSDIWNNKPQLRDYIMRKKHNIEEEGDKTHKELVKQDQKLGDKYNITSTDSAGNHVKHQYGYKTPHTISSAGPFNGSNVADMYHAKKNERRMAAASRLAAYLDKKGYDDKSYAKVHKENIKRANDAKIRLWKKHGDKGASGGLHRNYSDKEVNAAFSNAHVPDKN